MNEQAQQTNQAEAVAPVTNEVKTGITSITDAEVDALTLDTITREIMDVMTPAQIEKFRNRLSETEMQLLANKFSGSSAPQDEKAALAAAAAAQPAQGNSFGIPSINYTGGSQEAEPVPEPDMTPSSEPTEQTGAVTFED